MGGDQLRRRQVAQLEVVVLPAHEVAVTLAALDRAAADHLGGRERLDFTVIGRTVNIASRIESQCSQVGASALCSREFVDLAGVSTRSLGLFDLKGVAGKVELHALEL